MKSFRVSNSTLAWPMIAAVMFVNPLCGQDKNAPARPEFNPRMVVNRSFPPIMTPATLAADRITDEVSNNELVIGVVVNGEARAYPINMLTGPSREIINDVLGDKPIAATW